MSPPTPLNALRGVTEPALFVRGRRVVLRMILKDGYGGTDMAERRSTWASRFFLVVTSSSFSTSSFAASTRQSPRTLIGTSEGDRAARTPRAAPRRLPFSTYQKRYAAERAYGDLAASSSIVSGPAHPIPRTRIYVAPAYFTWHYQEDHRSAHTLCGATTFPCRVLISCK